ncbi:MULTISPECIES: Zn-ribbon domain-containing OB-fold protein [Archaeoglobus]|uniref:ChsH2 rubredoxin-like zinc ribbon domain-containing protein n=2 Tax=Archaeoglobus fulgidus TaxID=2234 RepID=A0A101DFQ6_ARCFL|nr:MULTISPECIES: Zn-ribbon domain-containing OB-fold protein [Archaeoglobus]AIG96969.1 putative nucleic-acid-binding protein [Archaeoglobus fulgidus DSM 8774]KUJ94674.1 MAG: hypothetical protein XD40_0238 [Archaeoglobus fulgidus]KUK05614.1 MAG: hypothetical protein XD48_2154 [Archaeoglobus fulgidus]MDI3498723.1 uncharacterized protein [Archaeoglobus sp.]
MGLIKEKFEKTMQVEGEWNVGAYRWKAPVGYLDEYVKSFRERKIIGSLCASCGRVYVPPREICARCFTETAEKVEVSQYGEVLAFLVSPPLEKGKVVIAGIDAVQAGFLKEGEQIILAMVRFEGTSSSLVLPLINTEPEKVRVGMKVKAVWAEECKGKLADLIGVEPAFEVIYK